MTQVPNALDDSCSALVNALVSFSMSAWVAPFSSLAIVPTSRS